MKLSKITIDVLSGMVYCVCDLTVQGVTIQVPFNVPEAALYARAEARGADSWDNVDLVAEGTAIVGQPIEF